MRKQYWQLCYILRHPDSYRGLSGEERRDPCAEIKKQAKSHGLFTSSDVHGAGSGVYAYRVLVEMPKNRLDRLMEEESRYPRVLEMYAIAAVGTPFIIRE